MVNIDVWTIQIEISNSRHSPFTVTRLSSFAERLMDRVNLDLLGDHIALSPEYPEEAIITDWKAANGLTDIESISRCIIPCATRSKVGVQRPLILFQNST